MFIWKVPDLIFIAYVQGKLTTYVKIIAIEE